MLLMELNYENISQLIDNKHVIELRNIFDYYNNVDLAKVIEKLSETQLLFIFKTMKTDITAEIFSYLNSDAQEKIISIFTSEEISTMLEYILTDDIVDFIGELPSNLVLKVLNATKKEKREMINHLLNLKEGTAGALLTSEYIELKAHYTCNDALRMVREMANKVATISYLYVIDNNRRLMGYLLLKEIIFHKDTDLVFNIMDKDIISVNINDNQDLVAKIFKTYDLNALPVLNNDGCLTGIITIDDVIGIIDDENTEDLHKLAAMKPMEETYLETPTFSLAKNRIIWLIVLMLAGIFTSQIIGGYEGSMGGVLPFLPLFIPMLMDTGGDAGSQTTTLIVRSLSMGEFSTKDILKVLKKEISVAFLSALLLALLGFGLVYAQKYLGIVHFNANVFNVALLLGISIFITIFCAKSIGVLLPMIASNLKIDPAVMAGPLLTTIIDTISLLIYYTLAYVLVLPTLN